MEKSQATTPSSDLGVSIIDISKTVEASGTPITTIQESCALDVSPRVYLTGFKLYSVIGGIASTIFLITLNASIVSTAIPRITSQFHSVADIGWYGSAYLLCS